MSYLVTFQTDEMPFVTQEAKDDLIVTARSFITAIENVGDVVNHRRQYVFDPKTGDATSDLPTPEEEDR